MFVAGCGRRCVMRACCAVRLLPWLLGPSLGSSTLLVLSRSRTGLETVKGGQSRRMHVAQGADCVLSAQLRPGGAGQDVLDDHPADEADAAAAEAAEHMSKARAAANRSPSPQEVSQGADQQHHTLEISSQRQESGQEQPKMEAGAAAATGDNVAHTTSMEGALFVPHISTLGLCTFCAPSCSVMLSPQTRGCGHGSAAGTRSDSV